MNITQVALQLYTVRNRMTTRKDLEATVQRIAEIGYPAVQISGLDWGLITEEDMVQLCGDNGLEICATHEPADTILNSPEEVVERLQKLGCRYTAYPYPANIDLTTAESVAEFISNLDCAGSVLRDAGLVLTYHNHEIEFMKLNGSPILDHIYRDTDPVGVQGEIDTFWIQNGGGDPVAWCRRLNGRLPLIHLKDYAIIPDRKITFAEIGAGNLDFPAICSAAEQSGCRWFIVEQDTCPGDEFESVRKSFEYIRNNLVE